MGEQHEIQTGAIGLPWLEPKSPPPQGHKQVLRLAAYVIVLDEAANILMVRLSSQTPSPGAWTLPGGAVEFGEHPADGAAREVHEETGYDVELESLLAVDSARLRGPVTGKDRLYLQSVRIIYSGSVIDGTLRHELDGSSDQAAWFSRGEAMSQSLVGAGKLAMDLAWSGLPRIPPRWS